jgi:hypothetical protein
MDRFWAAAAAARCFAETWFSAILDVCHRLAPRRHRVLNRPQRFIRLAHEAPDPTGSATISSLYLPCFHMPFRLPLGPPLPGAPPCIRHLPFGVAGDWQGVPRCVLAKHRAGDWTVHDLCPLWGQTRTCPRVKMESALPL